MDTSTSENSDQLDTEDYKQPDDEDYGQPNDDDYGQQDTDDSSEPDSSHSSIGRHQMKRRKVYKQKYSARWEELPSFSNWLAPSTRGVEFALCKPCGVHLVAGMSELKKHLNTSKHKKNVQTRSKQPTVFDMAKVATTTKLDHQAKEGEICMVGFVVEHNLPFSVMDHLPKLVKRVCPDSEIGKKLSCARTKATSITKNVIGKVSFENLVTLLQENKFALIIDESTDVGCTKHLAMVTRVLDKDNAVIDAFFGLVEVKNATAAAIFASIVEAFESVSIPWKKNIIGFAADGANVMMGKHNSVFQMLKSEIPSLFVMKCICHSFHLCSSYACAKLPRAIEDLARDIYSYLHCSSKRTLLLKEFQKFVQMKPLKILHPSQTRWLSLHGVVVRLLECWNALKLFFTDAVVNDRLVASETILRALNDPITVLYYEFLAFVLPFFVDLNTEMQSSSPKVHTLHKNVSSIFNMLLECYMCSKYIDQTPLSKIECNNPRHFLELEKIYLGAKVAVRLEDYNLRNRGANVHDFPLRCLDFFIEACTQIQSRFAFDSEILLNLNAMDPQIVLSKTISSIAKLSSMFPNIVQTDDMQALDFEWRRLRHQEFDSSSFNNIDDVRLFWINVSKEKKGDGSPMYPILSKFMLSLCCLPHSSASVERIFSAVNLLKTKQRNSLCTETLNGILHSKRLISSENSNCYQFNVTKKMLLLMRRDMY